MTRPCLPLSIALSDNPNTRPVIDGDITPEGIALTPTAVHPSEMFWRQLRFAEFDISEMSMSSLLIATARGPTPWVALPVFTTREFFHTRTLVRADAGIAVPADLKGKRVGVPEFQQTAAIWGRGVLENEFGVAPRDMEFFMERVPDKSHGGATGFKPPAGVTVHQIPESTNIGEMLTRGELDATLHYLIHRNLVDRSRIDLAADPRVRPLFPDRAAEGRRYYAKTGLYPINHGMVIKRAFAEKHPWVILNLMKAFDRANAIATRERVEHAADHVATGLLPADARAALGQPVIEHGIKANRKILETCADYSLEQGLTPRRMKLEEIFAACTMGQ